MTVARFTQVLQWPFRVMPLQIIETIREKLETIELFVSTRAAKEKAHEIAWEMSQIGKLKIRYREQHIGYLLLALGRREIAGEMKYWVKLIPSIHFVGRLEHVPDLLEGDYITFSFSHNPSGSSTDPASYLTIVREEPDPHPRGPRALKGGGFFYLKLFCYCNCFIKSNR